MGCTQSKIDNEETVTRCKDRKLFMKEAVSARNAFAAAHSGYTVALKNTGAALSDYSHGEVQYPQLGSSNVGGALPPAPQPPYESLRPPPPLPLFPSPLQRAATMPEISVHKSDLKHTDPIIEEENEEEMEIDSLSLKRRTSRSASGAGGSRSGISGGEVEDEGLPPPPSPPRTPPQADRTPPPPPPPKMSWDYFFDSDNIPGPSLADVDEARIEREEMERKMYEERAMKAEFVEDGGDSGGRRSVKEKPEVVAEKVAELGPPVPPATKSGKKGKQVVPADSKRAGKGASVSLVQIFAQLDDCFLKASQSAHDVSKMLEANRLHYHSNFAGARGINLLWLLGNVEAPFEA